MTTLMMAARETSITAYLIGCGCGNYLITNSLFIELLGGS